MPYDKKQLEILLMQYFRESYHDFPKGLLIPSESPDFIVTFKSRHQLGIELTRLFPGNAFEKGDAEIRKNEERERLIESVRELYESDTDMKLFVKFLFSEKTEIRPENELMAIVQVANIIRGAVKDKKKDSFFKTSFIAGELPPWLEGLLVLHHPALETPVWERSNIFGISNDVVADIRNAIRKKDEKLRLYRKQRLNYYWLLIFTDRLRGIRNFNLPEKIKNHRFESHFQHVFLFDLIKSDIYPLI